jgi:hypothetical protein
MSRSGAKTVGLLDADVTHKTFAFAISLRLVLLLLPRLHSLFDSRQAERQSRLDFDALYYSVTDHSKRLEQFDVLPL